MLGYLKEVKRRGPISLSSTQLGLSGLHIGAPFAILLVFRSSHQKGPRNRNANVWVLPQTRESPSSGGGGNEDMFRAFEVRGNICARVKSYLFRRPSSGLTEFDSVSSLFDGLKGN